MPGRMLQLIAGDIPPAHRKMLVTVMFRLLLVVHVAWACGWLASFGLPGFAQVSELRQVVRGQKIQQRTAYESELRRINQEIFLLDARAQELAAAGVKADRLYGERASDLRSERDRVQNRLQAFLRSNPDIADATF